MSVVGDMPAEKWYGLSHRQQGVLLLIDDYRAGRFTVQTLDERLAQLYEQSGVERNAGEVPVRSEVA